METRGSSRGTSSKRKPEETPHTGGRAPPKRARGVRAPAASSTATALGGRTARGRAAQRGTETRHTPDAPLERGLPDQGASAPSQEAAEPAVLRPEPHSGSGSLRQAEDLPMERGRRGSRGEAAGGGDDERDGSEGLGRNFGAASSALQGLLRKLGANFEDMLPMGVSGMRIKNILAGMKDFDDEAAQLSSLSELCELLSISSEESLATFPIEQIVPVLVQLLGMEHNPDVMLLAARALTFMADVLPASCGAIVRHGAVPAFCARLLTIEYIDLAEQSLQALDKLAAEHPGALLSSGGLLAVLSYLDFFPTGVQRTAVGTAAAMCAGLRPSHLSAVRDALPILTALLQYQDAKIVDSACAALLAIAEAYAHDAPLLEALQSVGLVDQALAIISAGGDAASGNNGGGSSSAAASPATYFGMVKLLATCAAGSAAIAQQLLRAGVVDALRALLTGSGLLGGGRSSSGGGGGGGGSSSAMLRTPDQLFEVVTLAHELLPPVPDAADMVLRGLPAPGGGAAIPPSTAIAGQNGALAEFLTGEQDMVLHIVQSLLPLMLQAYASTIVPDVRARCLATVVKLLAVAAPSHLQVVLADLPVSSFVAGLLLGRDVKAQAAALQLAEILMAKLPDIFAACFVKEGVAHALEQLATAAAASTPGGIVGAGGVSDAPVPRRSFSSGFARGELPPPSPPLTRSRRSSRADASCDEPAPMATQAGSSASAEAPAARALSTSLRDAVARRAATLKRVHFAGEGPGCGPLESDGLRALRLLCEQLSNDSGAVAPLLEALTASNVSVFEMVTSGAIGSLHSYLRGAGLSSQGGEVVPEDQLLLRLRHFAVVAFSPHTGFDSSGRSSGPLLSGLVRKLQSALASAEAFPVICSRLAPANTTAGGSGVRSFSRSAGLSGSFNSSNLSSGLAALTQPLKLRLMRHAEDTAVREYPPNIVLIEPLANMSAIEDFLWPRVNRGSSVEALRARAIAEAAAASSEAAAAAAAAAAATPTRDAQTAAGMSRRRSSSSGAAAAAPRAAMSAAQPIPDGQRAGRLTRAQARAARAEAQARAEEAASARRTRGLGAARRSGGSATGVEGHTRGGSIGGSSDMEDADDNERGPFADMEDEPSGFAHDMMDEDDDDNDEEEEGFFDDEDEDEDMEDGELGVGSMPVHDLHLADGAPGGAGGRGGSGRTASAATAAATSALATPPPPPARTAAAVAAAAAGPKLTFLMNGTALPPGCTVFQAIQQGVLSRDGGDDVDAAEEGASAGRGRALWEQVHTLHYRIATGEPPAAVGGSTLSSGGGGGSSSSGGGAARGGGAVAAAARASGISSRWLESPLGELLSASLPEGLAAPAACLEVLRLLQLLEALNRLAPRLVVNRELALLEAAAQQRGGAAAASVDAGLALGDAVAGSQLVPRDDFVSGKLGNKLSQQLKDVLSICGGGIPAWCQQLVVSCRFLFPFEARRRYFYATAFGLGRALHHMQQQQAAEGGATALDRDQRELRIGRLQRQKVRVSRRRILESAVKVMEMYARSRAVLELEYFNEVGTGLGPTLEFYTLLSHELQRTSLGLWRAEEPPNASHGAGGDEDNAAAVAAGATKTLASIKPTAPPGAPQLHEEPSSHDGAAPGDYVHAPHGLFPAPLPPSCRAAGNPVREHFRLLGRTVAKALQDSRLLDLPLSPVFFRAVMGRSLDLADVAQVDPPLGASLARLADAAAAHAATGGTGPALVDGAAVEDLCLCFTLPGQPDYELLPGGADVPVDSSNLTAYIQAVVDATLGSGISEQLAAFREGFGEVFNLSALEVFREDELEVLLCGSGERWTPSALADGMKFDHGYTSTSVPVRHLLEVLSELDTADQRRFLRFITGCPRLPPGGIAALQPRLTVVRKHPSLAPTGDAASGGTAASGDGPSAASMDWSNGTQLADGDLPSVMTCANYIKLPPYSCKAIMRQRLLFAIREGQGSFDLS